MPPSSGASAIKRELAQRKLKAKKAKTPAQIEAAEKRRQARKATEEAKKDRAKLKREAAAEAKAGREAAVAARQAEERARAAAIIVRRGGDHNLQNLQNAQHPSDPDLAPEVKKPPTRASARPASCTPKAPSGAQQRARLEEQIHTLAADVASCSNIIDRAEFERAATTCVFRAGPSRGVEEVDATQPAEYFSDVKTFEELVCECPASVRKGEYNAVLLALPASSNRVNAWLDHVAARVQSSGNRIVVRLTRSDDGGRYQDLAAVSGELYNTLFAAANGLGPRCFAALIVPTSRRSRTTGRVLYGALYVLERAISTLSEHIHASVQCTPRGRPSPAYLKQLGRDAAGSVLSVIRRLSVLGCVHLDVKLGNLAFMSGRPERKPKDKAMCTTTSRFIDFDASYFLVLDASEAASGSGRPARCWRQTMFVNLLLVTSHVYFYAPHEAIWWGWSEEVRDILHQLHHDVLARRGVGEEDGCAETEWLWNLNPTRISQTRDLGKRGAVVPAVLDLEAIIRCYFVFAQEGVVKRDPLRLKVAAGSPAVLSQLLWRVCPPCERRTWGWPHPSIR
jgi:hypothetical protein